MRADARVKAYALNDLLRAQAAGFGVGVELIKEADAQGKVGVCEKLHGLGLGRVRVQNGDILFYGSLHEQMCKGVRRLLETLITGRRADDYT